MRSTTSSNWWNLQLGVEVENIKSESELSYMFIS